MSDANPSLEKENPTGSESELTSQNGNPPVEVSEEMVKSHPIYKKLEEDHSAAQREKDRYKGRLDKVQKGISDDEPKEKPKDDSPYATKEEIWELKNSKDVELYGDDEYKKDIETGIPRDYALKTAKLRFQSNPDKARLERQHSMASGSASSTRNLQDNEYTDAEKRGLAEGLYSEYAIKKQRELKKARGQS